MASLIVETHVAQGVRDQFATAADELRAGLTEMAVHDSHVRHNLVPSDELGFHVVEADSAEDVIRLAKLAGIDVEHRKRDRHRSRGARRVMRQRATTIGG